MLLKRIYLVFRVALFALISMALVSCDADADGYDNKCSKENASAQGTTDEVPLLVQTRYGPVRGMTADSSRVFRGIRYAAAPVGPLRFAAPQPPEPWKEAPEPMPTACPQYDFDVMDSLFGTEDCLTLDVWTPLYKSARQLPVMVWIHGGGFTSGSGYLYDALLPTRDVVVVAINYRLGPLGFLAHPDLTAEGGGTSGNYEIQDQQLALQWVRDNISAFGGDPKIVTIFGESAGGASVGAHLVSVRSKGLFHRAIMESGTMIGRQSSTLAQAEAQGVLFAQAVSCHTAPSVTECLRQLPVESVLNALPAASFRPSVDGIVFERPALETISDGSYNRVPTMLGSNSDEALASLEDRTNMTEDQYVAYINDSYSAYSKEILSTYPVAKHGTAQLALAAVLGNRSFNCPARRTARALAQAGSDVYLYYFAQGIAYHAAELSYLFGVGLSPSEQKVSSAMKDYWTEFAKKGDPNVSTQPDWPRYQMDTEESVTIADPISVNARLLAEECDMWDSHL